MNRQTQGLPATWVVGVRQKLGPESPRDHPGAFITPIAPHEGPQASRLCQGASFSQAAFFKSVLLNISGIYTEKLSVLSGMSAPLASRRQLQTPPPAGV